MVNGFTVNKHNESTVINPTVARNRLLIPDGHSSHCVLEFSQFTRNHNISLVCLPPHTTHHLHPLDVEIFESLADSYYLELKE